MSKTTIIDLISAKAHLYAGEIAIKTSNEAATYQELDAASSQMGRLLSELGVVAGDTVALLLEPGLGLYTAVLGVLKAGAAFMPLDRSHPTHRLSMILDRARPRVVITSSRFLHVVDGGEARKFLLVDGMRPFQRKMRSTGRCFDSDDIGRMSASPYSVAVSPRDIAYIMHTSGTTGTPKGVVIEHSGLLNLAEWAVQRFEIGRGSCVAQFYEPTSDPFVQEFFSALVGGATLVSVPESARIDPGLLLEWLRDNSICYFDTVPSLFERIVEHVETSGNSAATLPSLRTIVLGGEALRGHLVRRWRSSGGTSQRIFNVYGPTEATVSATVYEVPEDVPDEVPIGRPLPNTRVMLLHPSGRGEVGSEPGELYLAGVGLARGYLGDTEGTRRAFVDIGTKNNTVRAYKTGDLVQKLPDGNYVFKGRSDQQVKVRGHRVELQELVSVMRACPGVSDAVVFYSEEGSRSRLVGYFIASHEVTAARIREHLSKHVPRQWLPHELNAVDSLPREDPGPSFSVTQSTEKLAPEEAEADELTESPGLDHLEMAMLSAWREVLQSPDAGPEDDFFELGGDSLATVSFQAACNERGIQVRPIDVLHHPTVRALAAKLRQSAAASPGARSAARTRPRRHGSENVLPLLGMQQKMLHDHLHVDRSLNCPRALIRLRGDLRLDSFEKAVNVLIARHEALRTVIKAPAAGPATQLVLRDATWTLSVVDLRDGDSWTHPAESGRVRHSWSPGLARKHQISSVPDAATGAASLDSPVDERVEQAVVAADARGLDIEHWPLFELLVYRLEDDLYDISWSIHHLFMDGWSTSMFYAELGHIYTELVNGRYKPASRPSLGYAQHVSNMTTAPRAAGESFWERQLSDMPRLELPTLDAAQSQPPKIRGYAASLEGRGAAEIRRLARLAGVSPQLVLLASYARLLGMISRSPEVVVGVVSTGRFGSADPAITSVIGNLINLLPVRVRLDDESTLAEVSQQLKRSVAEAMEHESHVPPKAIWLDADDPLACATPALFVAEDYPTPQELGFAGFVGLEVVRARAVERNGHPLTFVATQDDDGFQLRFEYRADLFRHEQVAGWADSLLEDLEALEGSA